MKHSMDRSLLLVGLLSLPVCVGSWFVDIRLILFLPVIPVFCLQLLLCRKCRRGWVRALPALPAVLLGLLALFYLLRDSGWDRLGALVFGLAAIAPGVGCLLGWGAWALPLLRRRRMARRERSTHSNDRGQPGCR